MVATTYDPERAHADLDREVARLEAQVELTWDKEVALLERLGVTDGQRVLDAGCGPGHLTERLLERFPTTHVTGVDVHRSLLEHAQRRLTAQGLTRCELLTGSLTDPALPSRAFDVVIVRHVLQHVPDPAAAVQALRRLLVPGGLLVVFDVDDALEPVVLPPLPALARLAQRLAEQRDQQGTHRHLGRWLPRLLAQAGLGDVGVEAIVAHSDEVGLAAFRHQLDPDRFAPLLETGMATDFALAEAREAAAAFLADPGALMMTVSLAAWGRRVRR